MNRPLTTISLPWYIIWLALQICLKVTGVISWGWGWVLAPVWIPVIMTFSIIIFMAVTTHRQRKRQHEDQQRQGAKE